MPNFYDWCVFSPGFSWLRGVAGHIRKDCRTATDVFLTATLHHMRVETHGVDTLSPVGAKTMPAISQASHRAAPASPAMGTIDPIQLHADAHNALNMAVFYLRQPQANTAAARRKAIQALAALRGLSQALEG